MSYHLYVFGSLEDYPWAGLIDPKAPLRKPTTQRWNRLQDYQRWFCHAIEPNVMPQSDQDRSDRPSPGKDRRGSLTHQLFAIYLARERGNAPADAERLIDTLCERIADEAAIDFRVTDIYLQRVAFVLAAGRPDLVKRRWVRRLLQSQQPDGGWKRSWYGLGPGVFDIGFRTTRSDAHATVQGVWILHMLKHRYPRWPESEP